MQNLKASSNQTIKDFMAFWCNGTLVTLHRTSNQNMSGDPYTLVQISYVLLLCRNWALIVHRFGDAIKIPSFIGPLCIQSKETLACVGPIINN